MTIKWMQDTIPGRIGVSVPYNARFNDELKVFVPSAKFNRALSAWMFDEEAKGDVVQLLERFYTNLAWVRVTWEFDRDNPEVDGARLMFINRDYWKFASPPYKFNVVEEDLRSGGSRANPGIYGRLVIDILCREGCEFSPEPVSVEAIDKDERPNPLGHIPTDMLLAELRARGKAYTDEAGFAAIELITKFVKAVENEDNKLSEVAYLSMCEFAKSVGGAGDE